MKLLLVICIGILAHLTIAQEAIYVFKNKNDSTVNSYLKIVPNSQPVKAIVVRDFTSLPDTSKASPYQFQNLCTQNGILTLYTSVTNVLPELFVSDSIMQLLDDIIYEVVKEHNVPEQNIFIGGISASGTRALRYAAFCAEGKSKNNIKIRGAFSVDSPLDLSRFYTSIQRNQSNFLGGMRWEADYMWKYFNELFESGVEDYPSRYENASAYSQHLKKGGNAKHLKSTSLILFHEPNIDWWLEERGCSYFDINSYDIAAFVMELRAQGNNDIRLITTSGKGFDRVGNRKPHSWSIVNEKLLLNWIIERIY